MNESHYCMETCEYLNKVCLDAAIIEKVLENPVYIHEWKCLAAGME